MGVFQKIAFLLILASAGAGCRSDGHLLPAPGTIQQQRNDATMFDPYTDVESGPEVEGGRPRDFQHPLSESDRSRMLQDNWSTIR